MRARPAEAERAVVVPLDLVQDLDEAFEGVAPDGPLVPPRLVGDLRVEPADPDRELDRVVRRGSGPGHVQDVGGGGHQYFRSIGIYGPVFTGLYSIRIEPSGSR